jgi:hypothetical protein
MAILKDKTTVKIYKTRICYRCPSPKFRHGKTIMLDDKFARKIGENEWVCGDCIAEMDRNILESMSRR